MGKARVATGVLLVTLVTGAMGYAIALHDQHHLGCGGTRQKP